MIFSLCVLSLAFPVSPLLKMGRIHSTFDRAGALQEVPVCCRTWARAQASRRLSPAGADPKTPEVSRMLCTVCGAL